MMLHHQFRVFRRSCLVCPARTMLCHYSRHLWASTLFRSYPCAQRKPGNGRFLRYYPFLSQFSVHVFVSRLYVEACYVNIGRQFVGAHLVIVGSGDSSVEGRARSWRKREIVLLADPELNVRTDVTSEIECSGVNRVCAYSGGVEQIEGPVEPGPRANGPDIYGVAAGIRIACRASRRSGLYGRPS